MSSRLPLEPSAPPAAPQYIPPQYAAAPPYSKEVPQGHSRASWLTEGSIANFFRISFSREDRTKYTINRATVAKVASCAMAVGMAALSYGFLKYGFYCIDTSFSRFDLFLGGASGYLGVVYAIVAVGNIALAICGCCFGIEEFTLATQAFVSLTAPIYFLPDALMFGLRVAMFLDPKNKKESEKQPKKA